MHKVIVEFLDGKKKEGSIFNFALNSPIFYLQSKNPQGKTENQPIKLDSVRQLSFLKKTENTNSVLHRETIDQSVYAGVLPYKLVVELKDGQIIDGSTNKYHPKDKGFFVVPLNPADRKERIYINAKAVKSVDCKRLLGKKLINQSDISAEEVEQAFKKHREEAQRKTGNKPAVKEERKTEGEDSGWSFFPPEDFFATEKEEKKLEETVEEIKPKPLGEIILEAGYITSEQLEETLNRQKKKKNKKLGQLLIEHKYITPNDVCVALATQCRIPWVDLLNSSIEKKVATALPEDAVKKLEIIPVEKKEDILVVATSQPQDPSIGLKISKYTPLAVELVVAYEGYIREAIDHHFPKRR